MSTTVLGLYRTEADVELVSEALAQGGFDRHEIMRHDETDHDLHGWLVAQGVPERDADDYAQGVRDGGKLVSVEVSDDRSAEAVEIMQLHERTAANRDAASTGAAPRRPMPSGNQAMDGEEVLEVVEERLEVGTRVVEGGGVRVNTFVTEKPVEQDVRVRNETIDVDRRPVDRPVTGADRDRAFQERSIEMTGRTEDVVVGKEARVVEEVVLSKDVDERTETVRDTVRTTEVEIERTDDLLAADRDYYRTHHRDTLGRDDDAYDEHEPAYRHGIDLAHQPDHQGRPWSEVAPSAKESWGRQNGRPWNESEPAVRHGYERASSRGRR